MLLIMLYITTILYGFLGRDKKYFWLWCALLFVLITNTSENFADYNNYEMIFMRIAGGEKSIAYFGITKGWYYLNRIFYSLGLSYRGMHAIIVIISFYLLHRFVCTIMCKESIFWGLFIVFPGLVQVVQLRFFLGTAIIFFSLGYFIRNEKWGLSKFAIGVLIASFVHLACALFAVFFLIILYEKMNIKKAVSITIMGVLIIILFISYVPPIVSRYIPRVKYERYFLSSITTSSSTWLITITLIWALSVLIGVFCMNKLKRCTAVLVDEEEENIFADVIAPRMVKCIILLVLTLPLLLFDMNFHRFIEMGYMILYVLIARLWKRWRIKYQVKCWYLFLFLCCLVWVTDVYTPFKTIIKPFFSWSGFHSLLY